MEKSPKILRALHKVRKSWHPLDTSTHSRDAKKRRASEGVEGMDREWLMFLAGAGALIVYLFVSAKTEMFTRWPWNKD